MQAIYETVRDRLMRTFGTSRGREAMDEASVEAVVDRLLDELAGERGPIQVEEREKVRDQLLDDVLGMGPLRELMRDPTVTEVLINAGGRHVFVERNGRKEEAPLRLTADELRALVARMLHFSPGRRVDASSPMVDLGLPGGLRVNIAIPPVVSGGPHLTIRKYLRELRSLDDLVAKGAMDTRMARFLAACVKARVNILVSGASGTGKTTLLDVLGRAVDPEDRVVVIEDTLELHLDQPDVVRLLTRPANVEGRGEITIGDLFHNCLRMRPSRILLGEIRGREALEWLQAINSGHRGTLACIHAATPEEALVRVEHLVALAGNHVPLEVVRSQCARGLDVVAQLAQMSDGTRRVVSIVEVAGQDPSGSVRLPDLFRFEAHGLDEDGKVSGQFVASGRVPDLVHDFQLAGVRLDREIFREAPPS